MIVVVGDTAVDAALDPDVSALPRVTDDVTTLVNRVLVSYTVLSLLPAFPSLVGAVPRAAAWWNLTCGLALSVSLVALVAAAVRRRPLRRPTIATATSLLVAVALGPFGFDNADTVIGLWWLAGPVGVAVALVFGLRVCAGYVLVLAVVFNGLRSLPDGEALEPVTAVSLVLYAVMVVLVIGAIGRGLITAAQAADELGGEVYRRELTEAVDRALADERRRLDRLIHDDVLTTMIAAAHADDQETVGHTATLARETLSTIDALQDEGVSTGTVAVAAFARLVVDTARRVSPAVRVEHLTPAAMTRLQIPVETAEVFLSAMREAVRNAVRHSGSSDIRVGCGLQTGAGSTPELLVTVTDGGRGFDPNAVPAQRLGITVSIVRALEAVGAVAEVSSVPGSGTWVALRGPVPAAVAVEAWSGSRRAGADPLLPARFPTTQLVRLAWAALAVELVRLALHPSELHPIWPTVVAVPLVIALTYLVFQRGRELRLPWPEALAAVGLIVAVSALIAPTLRRDGWPDTGMWFAFVLQLVFVGLTVRRRGGAALAGLLGFAAWCIWWAVRTPQPGPNVTNALFGPVAFVVLAFLVSRQLAVVARREAGLRASESAAVDDAARRHVAVVQRSLWLADLRQTARATLEQIAASTQELRADVRTEALLIEASLRESLVARNVMSEELADITEEARRRGVRVTFVDSRSAPVPDAVGQAVVAEVRGALSSQTVSRLVVRLAPDGRRRLASVVSEDEGDLLMVMIDADGTRGRDGSDE